MDSLTQHQLQQIKLASLRSKEETPAEDIRNALSILEMSGRPIGVSQEVAFFQADFDAILARLYTAVGKLEGK